MKSVCESVQVLSEDSIGRTCIKCAYFGEAMVVAWTVTRRTEGLCNMQRFNAEKRKPDKQSG